jgi:hypothetical protein
MQIGCYESNEMWVMFCNNNNILAHLVNLYELCTSQLSIRPSHPVSPKQNVVKRMVSTKKRRSTCNDKHGKILEISVRKLGAGVSKHHFAENMLITFSHITNIFTSNNRILLNGTSQKKIHDFDFPFNFNGHS